MCPRSIQVDTTGRRKCVFILVADGAAFIGRSALDLPLDQVERSDALNGFGGDGRVVRFHQIKKLAPNVRQAWRLLNRTALIELIESGKRVGLQYPFELGQVPLWVTTG